MTVSAVSKLFGIAVLLIVLSLLILLTMSMAMNYIAPWAVNVIFVWFMFFVGYIVGRMNK